jgi:hypothetical protein
MAKVRLFGVIFMHPSAKFRIEHSHLNQAV